MSISTSLCVSACFFVLPVCCYMCMSLAVCVCPSVCLFVGLRLSVRVSDYLPDCLFVSGQCVCFSSGVCLLVVVFCLSLSVSVCLFVYLPAGLSACLCGRQFMCVSMCMPDV